MPPDEVDDRVAARLARQNLFNRPYLVIRVVPLSLGAHAATAGPFIFLEFAEFKPVVYLEGETSCVSWRSRKRSPPTATSYGRWERDNRGT